MKLPSLGQEDSASEHVSPWRAILLGSVLSLVGFYFGNYGYEIVQALVWGQTSLTLGGVFVLLVAVALAAALGLIRRSWRLRPAELLVIYVMTIITTTVGGSGMLAFLVTTLPAGHYYATPENNWESFFEHTPWWLTVNDPRAIEGFYEASGTLYSVATLRAWAAPLAFWLIFATLLVAGTWALSNLVAEQWVNRERLNFPLAQLPLAMAGAGPGRGFWTSRVMWAGFLVPVLLQSINFIHYLYPAFPTIWLKARSSARGITAMPWAAIRPVSIAFYPFMIGIGFLLSTETSLSCWFFYWVSKAERLVCAALGLRAAAKASPNCR